MMNNTACQNSKVLSSGGGRGRSFIAIKVLTSGGGGGGPLLLLVRCSPQVGVGEVPYCYY